MSAAVEHPNELGELLAALVDGEMTHAGALRLEQLACESPAARRSLLDYLQLHGELYWDHAIGAGGIAGETGILLADIQAAPARRSMGRWKRFRSIAALVAASLVVAAGSWVAVSRNSLWRGSEGMEVVARLVRASDAVWADGSGPEQNTGLRAGQTFELRGGLAEIVFESGARAIVEGPAEVELQGPGRGYLHVGRLTAHVPPEAAGFVLATPSATVTDLGTEFGVAVDRAGWSEVHALAGVIQVRPEGASGTSEARELRAGQGLRLAWGADGTLQLRETPADPEQFARFLPESGAGSVAAMRRLVAEHPRLIHHYTFEGTAPLDRCRDRQGSLHLTEVVMCDGGGDGELRSVRGLDRTTMAVSPYRAAASGNTTGVALGTEAAFQPPPAMTVELLLKFRPPQGNAKGAVFAALATRDGRRASFLVAAAETGQLTQLLDADAPWVETEGGFAFVPLQWYYVASSLQVTPGQTRVNTYAADVSQGERVLGWLVRDRLVPDMPAASRLGIGKGFDANNAHAYPWSGELDEVAIYDSILDRSTLEGHLKAVVGARAEPQDARPPADLSKFVVRPLQAVVPPRRPEKAVLRE
jgi:hypothetical protein